MLALIISQYDFGICINGIIFEANSTRNSCSLNEKNCIIYKVLFQQIINICRLYFCVFTKNCLEYKLLYRMVETNSKYSFRNISFFFIKIFNTATRLVGVEPIDIKYGRLVGSSTIE